MVATKRHIDRLRNEGRMDISRELERHILSELGDEPFPYEWTEQDLDENIRRIVGEHRDGRLAVPPAESKYKRLLRRHEELQKDFLGLLAEYHSLRGALPGKFDWHASHAGPGCAPGQETGGDF